MATTYTVKQGDHVSKLAKQFGFADFRTIWDHPNNAALKKLRQNPNVLAPGDQLFIPDKQVKKESRPTGATHRFKAPATTLFLRIVVKNLDDQPVANTPCKLQIEDQTFQLTTDGKGKIEKEIPKTAENGALTIGGEESPIKIGHLDPVDQISGYRARLNNLGYNAGDSDDPNDPQLRSAIEEFQCDRNLTVDGICGQQTQTTLKQIHGC
jgi:Putative peptidoglycan binding domain/LysM domain